MSDTETGIRGIEPIDYIENLGRVADRLNGIVERLDRMEPVIQKMGEMFVAVDKAREQSPLVAKLFGLDTPKESRRDRKARLAEIQEMGEDDA